jgi:hypothetical protein
MHLCLAVSTRNICNTLNDDDGEYVSSMDMAYFFCMSPLITILHLSFSRSPSLSSLILYYWLIGSLDYKLVVLARVSLYVMFVSSFLGAFSHPFLFLACVVRAIF